MQKTIPFYVSMFLMGGKHCGNSQPPIHLFSFYLFFHNILEDLLLIYPYDLDVWGKEERSRILFHFTFSQLSTYCPLGKLQHPIAFSRISPSSPISFLHLKVKVCVFIGREERNWIFSFLRFLWDKLEPTKRVMWRCRDKFPYFCFTLCLMNISW